METIKIDSLSNVNSQELKELTDKECAETLGGIDLKPYGIELTKLGGSLVGNVATSLLGNLFGVA